MKELNKVYNPKEVEDKIYKFWLDNEYFKASVNREKEPYTIVMPPPNITGKLHMGHALDNTIQDILIRFKRMDGFSALWVPGTDHASIATEAKIVEAMAKENLTKDDIGREEFLKRAYKWKEQYGNSIVEQLKKLGSSCDWSRERFTLDEGCSEAVRKTFYKLYNKGLIYKGERLVNWCSHCLTSISDAEVEFSEKDGALYHIKYKVVDSDEFLVLATTRPETLLGDTAVAVHPLDERYKHLVGKMLELPLCNRQIPLISDEYVEMDFGTGVVKITPAHDPNDYEVGLRHNLPIVNILTDDAKINENGGAYKGLDRYDARKKIIDDLKSIGLIDKIEKRSHNVGECYRCHTVIEPKISNQWFVKMKDLAIPANENVRNGNIKFIPNRFSKTYFHWMDNIKDWCISRQLWWGHRIPAYYCLDCGHITVTELDAIKTCEKCGGENIEQDNDTLDTWFSSALWPFSTLGWPKNTEELDYFYPTNTLVTGYDIIFFWVARMIFSGVEQIGKVPFYNVFIHGIVRDENGKKMSKSLGNGIDPIEIINEFGADALRFTLATGNSAGNDMRFMKDKILANRNFTNKVWNATRFIMMNIDDDVKAKIPTKLNIEDKWILTQLNYLIKEYRENMDKFEIGLAGSKVYDFTWNVFCDWYIEIVKTQLNNNEQNIKELIVYIFTTILKLLHPFMPFITEEIYMSLPNTGNSIMVSNMPQYNENYVFEKEYESFKNIMDSIKIIRNIRSEMNVVNSKKSNIYIETKDIDFFKQNERFYKTLAFAENVVVGENFNMTNTVGGVFSNSRILMEVNTLLDPEKEVKRLENEQQKVLKDIDFLTKKLGNDNFVKKAPEKLVQEEKRKLEVAMEKLDKIKISIKQFLE